VDGHALDTRDNRTMIIEFITSPIGLAAIGSFLAGSFGYVTAVLVIRPLAIYHRLRRQIRAAIDAFADATDDDYPPPGGRRLRGYAAGLSECYQKALPEWYKLHLHKKGHAPLDAARDLMSLSKTTNRQHALQRIAHIRSALDLG
jgi:hypothetical protein